jgi:urease accessory protein
MSIGLLSAGMGRLGAALVDGASAVVEAAASDPLKLLVAVPRGRCAWAYATTYGGGLLAGDSVDLEVAAGAGARLLLATQASTKVYRSDDGRSAFQRVRARVAAGALLAALPDPVTPFAGSRLVQRTALDCDPAGSLLWCEAVTAGRVARAERWTCANYSSRIDLTVGGRLLARDALLLDPADGDLPARLGPCGALASLLIGGPLLAERAAAITAAVAARPFGAWPLATTAPLAGWGVLVRLGAHERESLERLLRALLGDLRPLLGDDPYDRRP